MSNAITLESLDAKLNKLILSIDGDEKDVVGLRPRLKIVEAGVERLVNVVEREKLNARVDTLEKVVEAMVDERTRNKAWIAGLAVGLGITSTTSLAALGLQLVRFLTGSP